MTIRLLRTFIAVADEGTFSAAAKTINVTHAAVSQQMQTLEADLDLTLFDRSRRSPVLTPVARALVEKARVIVSDYDNLVPSVLGDGGVKGTISLGALRTTLTGLTPQALAVFKTKYPDVRLRIKPGLTGALMTEVERGTLDGAIVTKPALMPLGVTFRPLATEAMQLITSRQETERDPINLLKSRPYIRFNRHAVVGTLIDNWILERQIKVAETMELDSPEAIASMVQANLGVSVVPAPAVRPVGAPMVREISLGEGAPHRIVGFVYRDGNLKMTAMNEVFAALQQVVIGDQMTSSLRSSVSP
ncbi:LysR family transcriptional regulator [Pseudooctadecabacter jejudonensis]|uniref:HTH-type transcriptional regulator GltR n=1 Tax=Pseudooctadecabacter jejudonensis TaxID=1391910 RepID=A0A1Y5SX41_9RHOB|nr:LysR family transcriptional regulator [Pseudooctadecabacter jejudonensis]SLN48870.1 HTH-type transcriptional regulator GltR [Pseudooctadecabacter jejudonensis]